MPGYEANNWNGMVAPAAHARAVVERSAARNQAVVDAPDMREKLLQSAFEPIADTPGEFTRYLAAERVKWGRVVREAHVKPGVSAAKN